MNEHFGQPNTIEKKNKNNREAESELGDSLLFVL